MEPYKVIFVCTGNICRSPLAHRMFEKIAEDRGVDHLFEVESAGVGAWHVGEDVDRRMRQIAAAHGLNVSHRATKLTGGDLDYYDAIIVMTEGHRRDIISSARKRDVTSKIKLLREYDPETPAGSAVPEVPDPYYGGPDGFEDVYRIVERSAENLIDTLLDEIQTGGSIAQ